jgi:hypothetical protein
MPSIYSFLNDGLNYILDNSNNCLIKLVNYTQAGSQYYDDYMTQVNAGSSWISGLIFPVKAKTGSNEALLMEQGKLLTNDKVIFIKGSVNVNSSGLLVGIGSPVNKYYTLIADGITTYEVNGSPVYKKLYVRHTINGSIF